MSSCVSQIIIALQGQLKHLEPHKETPVSSLTKVQQSATWKL